MLETIVAALLPVVVTLLLGLFAGWERNFTQDSAKALNRMVMLYALPLALFVGILSTPISDITRNGPLFIWIAVGMIGGFFLVFLLSRFVFRSSSDTAALRALVITAPSAAFVGTSVLGALFPSDADLAIAVVTLVINIIQIPLTLFFLAGGNPARGDATSGGELAAVGRALLNAVRQPVVWAPVLAYVLVLLGLRMPPFLKGSFTLLGQATGGVALFAVGIVLFSQKVSVSLPVAVNVVAKNIALPAIIFFAMKALGVPDDERAVTTIALSIPSTSIAVIFAVQYGTGQREMASTLFWSTILSVVTMGGFIWVTG